MRRTRFSALATFVRARFSPDAYLGLHLTTGLLLLIGGALLFAGIAEDVVTADPITVLDVHLAQWFHAHATAPLTRLMLLITNLHGTLAITAYSLLFAFFLIRKKDWHWLLILVVAVPGGMLLNVLLKNIFQRARPSFDNPLLTLTTYSFPSGHTAGSTLFYGVLAAYLLCHSRSWRARVAIVVFAVLLVLLVGLSRIYLGVHYLSDVLAAIAASGAWLALGFTAVGTWRRRTMHRINT